MDARIGLATMLTDNFLFSLNLFKNLSHVFEPESNEYVLVQNWLRKLSDYDCTDPNDRLERNAYLNLLSLCLMDGVLHFPFTYMPQDGKLPDIYGSGESEEASSLRSQGCSICGLRHCLHFGSNSENPLHETESVFLEGFSDNNIQSVSQENTLDSAQFGFDSSESEWIFPEENSTPCSSPSNRTFIVKKCTGKTKSEASGRTFRVENNTGNIFSPSPSNRTFVVMKGIEKAGLQNITLCEPADNDWTSHIEDETYSVHSIWKRGSHFRFDTSASDRSFPEENDTENVFLPCSSLNSTTSAVKKSTGKAESLASGRTFAVENSRKNVFPSCSSQSSSPFVVKNSTENTGSKNSGRLLYESATTDRSANVFPFSEREPQDDRPSFTGQLIPHTERKSQYLQPDMVEEPKSTTILHEDHLNRTISITVNSCQSGNCDCVAKSDVFGEKEYEERIQIVIYNLLRDIRAKVYGKVPPGRNSYFDHLLSRYKDFIAKFNKDAAILSGNRSGRKLRTFMLLHLRKEVEQFAKDIFSSDPTSRAQNNITSMFPFSEIEPKNARSSLHGSTVVDEPKSTTYLHEDDLNQKISITTVNSCKSGNCNCVAKSEMFREKEYEKRMQIFVCNLLRDIRAEVHGKVPAGRNSYFDYILSCYKEFFAKYNKDAALLAAIHNEQTRRSFLLLNLQKDLKQLAKDISASDRASRAQNNTTSVYSSSEIEKKNAKYSLHGSVVVDEPKSTTFLHEDHLNPNISITTVNSCKCGNCNCRTKNEVFGDKYVQKSANLEEDEELLQILIHNLLRDIHAELHGEVPAGRNSYFDLQLCLYNDFFAKYNKDAATLAAIHSERSLRSFLLHNLQKDLEKLAKDCYYYF